VVKEALRARGGGEMQVHERIDWWLEEGGDEYALFYKIFLVTVT